MMFMSSRNTRKFDSSLVFLDKKKSAQKTTRKGKNNAVNITIFLGGVVTIDDNVKRMPQLNRRLL
jgi:hypothetical protein